MEIKLPEKKLDSTYFRVLFELAKKESPEALQNLLRDLKELERMSLGHTAIFKGTHPTLSLTSKNKSTIKFLRERKKELEGLNLLRFDVADSVNQLVGNPSLLDTYLENARLLESYRIGNVKLPETESGLYGFNTPVSIYKDLKGTIEEIVKYYTDGEFKYTVYPASKKVGKIIYEAYSADLSREVPATWVLGTENRSTGYQYRTIYIENFAFDTTKLPTEEELQSYDFPLSLKQLFKK